MSILLTILLFSLCFAGLAIGLLVSKKALRKGCSDSPDDCACLSGRQARLPDRQACRGEGKDPQACDQ